MQNQVYFILYTLCFLINQLRKYVYVFEMDNIQIHAWWAYGHDNIVSNAHILFKMSIQQILKQNKNERRRMFET